MLISRWVGVKLMCVCVCVCECSPGVGMLHNMHVQDIEYMNLCIGVAHVAPDCTLHCVKAFLPNELTFKVF